MQTDSAQFFRRGTAMQFFLEEMGIPVSESCSAALRSVILNAAEQPGVPLNSILKQTAEDLHTDPERLYRRNRHAILLA